MLKILIPLMLTLPTVMQGAFIYTATVGTQELVQFTLPTFQSIGFITSFDFATTTFFQPITEVVFDLTGSVACPLFSGLTTMRDCVEVDHTSAMFGSLVDPISPGVYRNALGGVSLTIVNTVPEPAATAVIPAALIGLWMLRQRLWRASQSDQNPPIKLILCSELRGSSLPSITANTRVDTHRYYSSQYEGLKTGATPNWLCTITIWSLYVNLATA